MRFSTSTLETQRTTCKEEFSPSSFPLSTSMVMTERAVSLQGEISEGGIEVGELACCLDSLRVFPFSFVVNTTRSPHYNRKHLSSSDRDLIIRSVLHFKQNSLSLIRKSSLAFFSFAVLFSYASMVVGKTGSTPCTCSTTFPGSFDPLFLEAAP